MPEEIMMGNIKATISSNEDVHSDKFSRRGCECLTFRWLNLLPNSK